MVSYTDAGGQYRPLHPRGSGRRFVVALECLDKRLCRLARAQQAGNVAGLSCRTCFASAHSGDRLDGARDELGAKPGWYARSVNEIRACVPLPPIASRAGASAPRRRTEASLAVVVDQKVYVLRCVPQQLGQLGRCGQAARAQAGEEKNDRP